jgi:hypothetical protein
MKLWCELGESVAARVSDRHHGNVIGKRGTKGDPMKFVYVVTASPDNKLIKRSEPYDTEKAAHDAGEQWIKHNVIRGEAWYLDVHPMRDAPEAE